MKRAIIIIFNALNSSAQIAFVTDSLKGSESKVIFFMHMCAVYKVKSWKWERREFGT